ncbi:MAG: ABC transporter ATP-binding protein [Bilifractor sp.]
MHPVQNENTWHLHLDGLSVGYNGHPVIRDIHFGIHRGEIVTLIGPNGAGKSTILKSITRQLALISGTVIFDQKSLSSYSYRDLSSRMAVVLTDRFHPELMTCHDVVATGRYPYTGRLGRLTKEDEQKVDDAMRAVQAQEIGGRDFNAISDGQKQRVLLARAICQDPDIIILDEPTSFLDIKHKLKLLSILRTMAKQKNITVVMSLHEIDLAMKISDRILCIRGDKIFRSGPPEEIFTGDTIRELYDIDNGSFDTLFGSVELPGIKGEPEVLVLSTGGTGIPVYRKLQREKRPFVAGILYTNDVDYRVARLLASRVISEKPFHEISDGAMQQALDAVRSCAQIIDAGVETGPCNRRMEELIRAAHDSGKCSYTCP